MFLHSSDTRKNRIRLHREFNFRNRNMKYLSFHRLVRLILSNIKNIFLQYPNLCIRGLILLIEQLKE